MKRQCPSLDDGSGLEDDVSEPAAKKIKLSNNEDINDPITLNVGGVKYQTTLSTLTNHSNTVLSKMFDGTFCIEKCDDGSYFIDRDGENFGIILNYLRNNRLIYKPNDEVIKHVFVESQYYQIDGLIQALGSYNITSNILNELEVYKINQFIEETNTKQLNNWKKIYQYDISTNTSKNAYSEFYTKCVGVKPMLSIFNLHQMKDKVFGCYTGIDVKREQLTDKNSFCFQVRKNGISTINIDYYTMRSGAFNKDEEDGYHFLFGQNKHLMDKEIVGEHLCEEIEISKPYEEMAIMACFTEWEWHDEQKQNGIEGVRKQFEISMLECYQV